MCSTKKGLEENLLSLSWVEMEGIESPQKWIETLGHNRPNRRATAASLFFGDDN